MKKTLLAIANNCMHVVIVLAILCVPLFYIIGKGEGYFFSIYDIYKEVLIQSVALILLGLYALRTLTEETTTIRRVPLYIPLALYVIILLVSFTQMINHYEGFIFLKRWVSYFVILFVVANYCDTKERMNYYINLILIVGAGLSVYGILQFNNIDFPFLVQNFKGNATDGNPNFTGQYMGILFPLALWKGIAHFTKKRALLFFLAAGIIGFFILLNKTKGVWIGLAVSSSVVVAYTAFLYITNILQLGFNDDQKKMCNVVLTSVASVGIVFVVFSALTFVPVISKSHPFLGSYRGQIRDFFTEFEQFKMATALFTPQERIPEESIQLGDTTMQRICIWQNTLKLIQANPFLGVGLGNFKIAYQPYRTRKEQISTGPDVFVRRTHNEYLQLCSELGPLGLGAFFAIQLFLYGMAHRVIVRVNSFEVQCAMLGFVMSFMTIFTTATFGFALQNPNPSFTLWLLVGLFCAFYWIVWQQDEVRFLPSRMALLCNAVVEKRPQYARVLAPVCDRTIAQPVVQRGKKKKQAGCVAEDSVWQLSATVRKFLVPVLLLCMVFGLVGHYWVWKPAHAFYNRQFGQALQRMGLHEKALIVFKKSLKDDPTSWETLFLLANEYAAMNQQEKAIEAHLASLKLNPYHAKAHYNIANTYNKRKEYDEAIHHYELACRYDSMLHQAFCNLGAMYFQTKQYDKSIEFYKKSIEINPQFFSAYYNIAYALVGLGRIGEAVPYLRAVKKMQPNNAKVLKLEDRVKKIIQQAQQRK